MKAGTEENQETLRAIEMRLAATLQPVTPSPAFVAGLRSRLGAAYDEQMRAQRDRVKWSPWQALLLAVTGLFSGVLIIFTGVRAVLAVLGALRMLRPKLDQLTSRKESPVAATA